MSTHAYTTHTPYISISTSIYLYETHIHIHFFNVIVIVGESQVNPARLYKSSVPVPTLFET